MSNWTPNYDQITGIHPGLLFQAGYRLDDGSWLGVGRNDMGTGCLVVVVVTLASCIWSYFNNPTGKTIQ